jgi:hypothetical protein
MILIIPPAALLIYWMARTYLLQHGTKDQIDKRLDADLALGRKLLHV